MASGQLQTIEGQVPVTIVLEDGTEYPEKGRLLFTDLTVNENTGQVSLRAEIPNASNLLMPGMYVQVKIPQAQVNSAVLIPQQAVTRGTTGDTVMVVNADGSYAPKTITIAQSQGNSWVVTGGLNAGDQVIIEGMAAVQMMGAKKVQPKPWQPEQPSQNPNQPAPTQQAPATEQGKAQTGGSAPSAEQK